MQHANAALRIKRQITNNRPSALLSTSRYRWTDPTGGRQPAGCKEPARTDDEKRKQSNEPIVVFGIGFACESAMVYYNQTQLGRSGNWT